MEPLITINADRPVNQIELSIVQGNDTYVIVENPLIDSCFSCINTVRYIHNESIQSVFKVNDDGTCVRTDDKGLALYLKHPYSLKDLAGSNYECEHTKVFLKAFQNAVSPFIYDGDIPYLWRSEPNRLFYVYDEESGQLKSSMTTAQLKNALVMEIYILTNMPDFKSALYARLDKSKRQYKRARKLVQALRDTFSKVLVIRIDFCWKASIEDDSTFNEMKANFAQLLKSFHHSKDLPNIVGYLWKLEFGEKKGYHFHCIFFMDGNKFQSDTHYSEMIGQRWTEITLGKGYYFNCHRDKIKYRHLAIGMARHSDQTFFDNLDQVLVYICKQDQFLIDKRLLGSVHTFGTSKCTKHPKTVGRPRIFNIIPNPIPQGKSTTPVMIVKKKQPLKPTGDSL